MRNALVDALIVAWLPGTLAPQLDMANNADQWTVAGGGYVGTKTGLLQSLPI